MSSFEVIGGKQLKGSIVPQGAKNEALQILSAVVLTKEPVTISNIPDIPACYGGFETLAEHLASNLTRNYAVTVYCSGKKYKKEERLKTYKGAKLVYLPLDANGKSSILYDFLGILHALFFSDVLIVLGVFRFS